MSETTPPDDRQRLHTIQQGLPVPTEIDHMQQSDASDTPEYITTDGQVVRITELPSAEALHPETAGYSDLLQTATHEASIQAALSNAVIGEMQQSYLIPTAGHRAYVGRDEQGKPNVVTYSQQRNDTERIPQATSVDQPANIPEHQREAVTNAVDKLSAYYMVCIHTRNPMPTDALDLGKHMAINHDTGEAELVRTNIPITPDAALDNGKGTDLLAPYVMAVHPDSYEEWRDTTERIRESALARTETPPQTAEHALARISLTDELAKYVGEEFRPDIVELFGEHPEIVTSIAQDPTRALDDLHVPHAVESGLYYEVSEFPDIDLSTPEIQLINRPANALEALGMDPSEARDPQAVAAMHQVLDFATKTEADIALCETPEQAEAMRQAVQEARAVACNKLEGIGPTLEALYDSNPDQVSLDALRAIHKNITDADLPALANLRPDLLQGADPAIVIKLNILREFGTPDKVDPKRAALGIPTDAALKLTSQKADRLVGRLDQLNACVKDFGWKKNALEVYQLEPNRWSDPDRIAFYKEVALKCFANSADDIAQGAPRASIGITHMRSLMREKPEAIIVTLATMPREHLATPLDLIGEAKTYARQTSTYQREQVRILGMDAISFNEGLKKTVGTDIMTAYEAIRRDPPNYEGLSSTLAHDVGAISARSTLDTSFVESLHATLPPPPNNGPEEGPEGPAASATNKPRNPDSSGPGSGQALASPTERPTEGADRRDTTQAQPSTNEPQAHTSLLERAKSTIEHIRHPSSSNEPAVAPRVPTDWREGDPLDFPDYWSVTRAQIYQGGAVELTFETRERGIPIRGMTYTDPDEINAIKKRYGEQFPALAPQSAQKQRTDEYRQRKEQVGKSSSLADLSFPTTATRGATVPQSPSKVKGNDSNQSTSRGRSRS